MVALLDVNVLVALTWPTDAAHKTCREWFIKSYARGWATCPLTQTGYVRVLANPAFSPDAPTLAEASARLERHLTHPGHQFWPADLQAPEVWRFFANRLHGHRQVTDAYLLGLAIHHNGVLATRDRGIRSLLPAGSPLLRHVLVLE